MMTNLEMVLPAQLLLLAVIEFLAVLGLLALVKGRRDRLDAAREARLAAAAQLLDSDRALEELARRPELLTDVHELLAADKAGRPARLDLLLDDPRFPDVVALATAAAGVDDDERLAHAADELAAVLNARARV